MNEIKKKLVMKLTDGELCEDNVKWNTELQQSGSQPSCLQRLIIKLETTGPAPVFTAAVVELQIVGHLQKTPYASYRGLVRSFNKFSVKYAVGPKSLLCVPKK